MISAQLEVILSVSHVVIAFVTGQLDIGTVHEQS
jgi:hypothetical protein